MGNFYVNYTTRGPEREAVAKCLQSAKRKAFVSPTIDGTTVFFDEESDSQDDEIIRALAERVSRELSAPVLAVLNHDDDILIYWLFESGNLADKYNSCPGYFSDDDDGETPAGCDAQKLCAAFGSAAKPARVDKVLRNEEYVFAVERHQDLADLLKHPWPYVCMGYGYIKEGPLPNGMSKNDLQAIG